jgi:hypothetical protein
MTRKTGEFIIEEMEMIKSDIVDLQFTLKETTNGTISQEVLKSALSAKMEELKRLEQTVYIEAEE